MAYEKTIWKARKGVNLNKYNKSKETETSVILTNTPDEITEPGTPFSANNMNKIESGIENAHIQVSEETDRAEQAETTLDKKISAINSKIPNQATADNQLADKAFVNSTVAYWAAFSLYKTPTQGAFKTVADLRSATVFYLADGTEHVPNINDVTIILADEERDGNYKNTTTLWKYFSGAGWGYYVPLGTAMSSAQLAALNSGITAEIVRQILGIINENEQYDIGDIYITTSDRNPAERFGGVWERWGKGKTFVGVDENQSEFNAVEKTGGAKTHVLTLAQGPRHRHYMTPTVNGIAGFILYPNNIDDGGNWLVKGNTGRTSTSIVTQYDKTTEAAPHNNLQPYITSYSWKRIA